MYHVFQLTCKRQKEIISFSPQSLMVGTKKIDDELGTRMRISGGKKADSPFNFYIVTFSGDEKKRLVRARII